MLTTAAAKGYLRQEAGNAIDDELIEAAVSSLTSAFDDHLGPVLQRTITNERHGPGSGAGRPRLWVRRAPVTAWTSVVEYDGTRATTLMEETPGVEPLDAYLAETDENGRYTGWIMRRLSGRDFYFARSWVVVTYTAGRFADVASVPDVWREAAGLALKAWWRQYESSIDTSGEYDVPRQSFPTFAIPRAVFDLLPNEARPLKRIGVG